MKISILRAKESWRTASWMVRFYQNRLAKRKFFTTKEEAEMYAREIRDSLKFGIDSEDLSEAYRIIAGTGYKLQNLVSTGLKYIKESEASGISPTATFADGIQLILSSNKRRRAKTLLTYRSVFRTLERVFGSRVATSITGRDVSIYLDRLSDRHGNVGKASPDTKLSAVRHIRMVLRALGVKNPLPDLLNDAPQVREIRYFSLEQIRTMLAAADPSEKGMVALAIFAAIRPLTLERLPADCVSVPDRMIRIPGELSKDHRAHCLETVPVGLAREIRPGPPPVLWQWLEKYPFQPRNWFSVQRRLRESLGGYWIQDGLRHSGATYFRAKYGDAATAELLTHASIALVNRHYAGLATRAQAEEFFALNVESISSLPVRQVRRRKVILWPSDVDLARWLSKTPADRIGEILGCSGSAVAKRCKTRGIPKRGRGEWSKMRLDSIS